ncbi:hypothetical protein SEA_PLUMBUS_30 [Mycobacterium phage Plumbus]|uniref:Uncharacterized protein n=1 Tax=Mycobacterium phage Plumbus TaxID=2790994 RepID=A0A7T3KCH9_9CAUD|nr:hypothetical protein KNV67_gp030 [Mycobacterium phage Plumbus]QPX62727.1 hypothetical protein SEA_PLUMBUS_30 [Mycobacterium phage Plumbus]
MPRKEPRTWTVSESSCSNCSDHSPTGSLTASPTGSPRTLPDLSDLDDQIVAKLPDLTNLPEQVINIIGRLPRFPFLLGGKP